MSLSFVVLSSCDQAPSPAPPPRPPIAQSAPSPPPAAPARPRRVTPVHVPPPGVITTTAELTILSCDAVHPDWKPGRFAMMLTIDIVAESPDLVLYLGYCLSRSISDDPEFCASAHEIGGAILPLAGPFSTWADQIDLTTEFARCVTCHQYSKAELKPTADGKWRLAVPADLVCERKPTGRVTVTLDGEAIRNSLAAWMGGKPIRSVAVGGLTSQPAELEIPAVTVRAIEPPTAGAGIDAPP